MLRLRKDHDEVGAYAEVLEADGNSIASARMSLYGHDATWRNSMDEGAIQVGRIQRIQPTNPKAHHRRSLPLSW